MVEVPDVRLNVLSELVKPEKTIPAIVEFVDIAGLVAGASKGEGLGNQFLANIRETDAIAHVVRCFSDENVVHVNGKVDPSFDAEVINTELALADLASVEKQLLRFQKQARAGGDKDAQRVVDVLQKVESALNQGKPARALDLSKEELAVLRPFFLLTMKPVMYVANVSDNGFDNNPYLDALVELSKDEGASVVAISAALEAQLIDLDDEEKQIFLDDIGMEEPGLNRVIRAAYGLLGLQTYFTAGKKEVRAWTVRRGSSAPQAAGVIHTDFEKGFIRAEVIGYDDYVKFKGEHAAKEAGKMRLEGKDYLVIDGDVMHFRFNV